jgi:hypothetical protein
MNYQRQSRKKENEMTNSLPADMEQDVIENMSPGDTGYTTPWAMWSDPERRLWINGKYPVYKEPDGTAHMHIEMTKSRVVRVYKSSIRDEKYEPRDSDWKNVSLPVDLVG